MISHILRLLVYKYVTLFYAQKYELSETNIEVITSENTISLQIKVVLSLN